MFWRYFLLFAGALLHIASNEVHMLNATHLKYHLDDVPHGTLAGSDFFCFAYVLAIAAHLVYDAYAFRFRLVYRYVVAGLFLVLPLFSVVSYAQYTSRFYYEFPLSVVAAVCVAAASIVLLIARAGEKRPRRSDFDGLGV